MNPDFIESAKLVLKVVLFVFAFCGVAALFSRWLRPIRCYSCEIREAVIQIGGYPVCRECWGRITAARNQIDALFSKANVADQEIEEFFKRNQ